MLAFLHSLCWLSVCACMSECVFFAAEHKLLCLICASPSEIHSIDRNLITAKSCERNLCVTKINMCMFWLEKNKHETNRLTYLTISNGYIDTSLWHSRCLASISTRLPQCEIAPLWKVNTFIVFFAAQLNQKMALLLERYISNTMFY